MRDIGRGTRPFIGLGWRRQPLPPRLLACGVHTAVPTYVQILSTVSIQSYRTLSSPSQVRTSAISSSSFSSFSFSSLVAARL